MPTCNRFTLIFMEDGSIWYRAQVAWRYIRRAGIGLEPLPPRDADILAQYSLFRGVSSPQRAICPPASIGYGFVVPGRHRASRDGFASVARLAAGHERRHSVQYLAPFASRALTQVDDRGTLEVLDAVLCAESLALSRSNLGFFVLAHSKAERFYLPTSCGSGTKGRMRNSAVERSPDNTTLLLLERPTTEVMIVERDWVLSPGGLW